MPVAAVTAPVPQARRRDAVPTSELNVVPATTTSVQLGGTGQLPVAEPWVDDEHRPARPGFRLRPLLFVALLGAAAAAVGALATLIRIEAGPQDLFDVGSWKVNDFGTNNTMAGLLAAAAMVIGALAWCFGYRWGAGLAGGAGAALAGWVALIVGLAEWPIATAEAAAASAPSTITRDVGYWALVGAGAIGLLVLLLSLARAGRNRRSGLDPWIAALGAVSFLIAAGGPLIPEGTADWSGNYSSDSLGVDLPTLFFVGRGVQLGFLALVGAVGFLLVRRYGLGLAVGAATACGWLLVTAATEQTADPIGPGFANPGADRPAPARRHDRRHGDGRLLRPGGDRHGPPRRRPLNRARRRRHPHVAHSGHPATPWDSKGAPARMGILDKLKGLVKGREDQVKTGIDKVSDTAESKVPAHAEKIDDLSDKAKDAVDNLAKDTPADPAPPAATPPPATEP